MPLLQEVMKFYFHNPLNYASTPSIEEVMKFYNLGDKTFETDFKSVIILNPCMPINYLVVNLMKTVKL